MGQVTAGLPNLYMMDIRASSDIPLRVLVIPPGVAGPNRHRAPADADRKSPLVEFYDRRYDIDGEHGQFTGGSYELETLVGDGARHGCGLNLNGDMDAWWVDEEAMVLVRAWLVQLDARRALRRRRSCG